LLLPHPAPHPRGRGALGERHSGHGADGRAYRNGTVDERNKSLEAKMLYVCNGKGTKYR
jgi:hypothetical protein